MLLPACSLGSIISVACPGISTTQDAAQLRMSSLSGLMQVHGARLAPGMLAELGWRWRHGPDVVIKVQNARMQARRLHARIQ